MTTNKNCKLERCKEPFLPEHGNQQFCCEDHQEEAKLEMQKEKRDPVKHFFPIMMKNNLQIEIIVGKGIFEVTDAELEAFGVDVSLLRHLRPTPEFEGMVLLDSGGFFLVTDTYFKKFKILKHEPATATVTTV